MGVEVLGGASGFTPTEPCTGLAFCYNGEYLLIDAIPFLDQHLFARGISKNQVAAVFLTHLHDDHSSLFPLMVMTHEETDHHQCLAAQLPQTQIRYDKGIFCSKLLCNFPLKTRTYSAVQESTNPCI